VAISKVMFPLSAAKQAADLVRGKLDGSLNEPNRAQWDLLEEVCRRTYVDVRGENPAKVIDYL